MLGLSIPLFIDIILALSVVRNLALNGFIAPIVFELLAWVKSNIWGGEEAEEREVCSSPKVGA